METDKVTADAWSDHHSHFVRVLIMCDSVFVGLPLLIVQFLFHSVNVCDRRKGYVINVYLLTYLG